jgi:hypothetical protein
MKILPLFIQQLKPIFILFLAVTHYAQSSLLQTPSTESTPSVLMYILRKKVISILKI